MRANSRRFSSRRSAIGYALATFVGVVVATLLVGATPPRLGGALLAWAIQGLAFWRLSEVLAAGQDARRVWAGGMAARGFGLAACGGPVLAKLASSDVLIAYGISMLGLLLTEAVWLAWAAPSTAGVGAKNEFDRTHSTG